MANLVPATLAQDAYKQFHPAAYHPDVSEVYANYINRSGRLSNIPELIDLGGVVNFGVQRFCMEFLIEEFNNSFFSLPECEAIEMHSRIVRHVLGKEANVERLIALHQLGYLPLRVKTIKEGTIVPYKVATVTVRSTKEGFQWLSNSIETVMSCEISGVSTSATTATAYMKTFLKYAVKSGFPLELVPFQGHDFSMRGMIFGRHGAYLSALGHLASGLVGTDTFGGVVLAERFYRADIESGNELVGCSVDATEHSVTCSWIEEGEELFLDYLMNVASPTGILSVVADTWDFENFVCNILPKFHDAIMAREGMVVIRPDSGDPVKVLTGYKLLDINGANYTTDADAYLAGFEGVISEDKKYAFEVVDSKVERIEISDFEAKGLIEELWDQFGGTFTEGSDGQHYKMLDEHIGAIYGDSITLERQELILSRLLQKGFNSKVVLGIGSYTYQYVTRDTHGSAVKATSMIKDGRRVAIFKDPKTDRSKKSARGLLWVGYDVNGNIVQEDDVSEAREETGLLETIFENGYMTKSWSFQEVRNTIREQLLRQLGITS